VDNVLLPAWFPNIRLGGTERHIGCEAILAEADQRGGDLIAMGVTRRAGEKLFFGDTAATILEKTPTSVCFSQPERLVQVVIPGTIPAEWYCLHMPEWKQKVAGSYFRQHALSRLPKSKTLNVITPSSISGSLSEHLRTTTARCGRRSSISQ
jgi:hypothetical protein